MATRASQPTIVLASGSPRRAELLALAGLVFEVRPAAAVEIAAPGERPEAFAQRMSRTKARRVAPGAPGALVIGADTIVVLDDREAGQSAIIGKPRDAADAAAILRRLRGRAHRVLTALTVIDTAAAPVVELEDLVAARVPMRDYTDQEIDAYVATGNPLDKAGAYAIQYAPFQPVDLARFDDCMANVMGLPVCRLLRLLQARLQARGVTPGLARPLADCEHFAPQQCPIASQIVLERAR